MERLNKMVVKKMSVNSPEYKENNLWIVDGTPQELWNIIWEHNALAASFHDKNSFWYKPLQRNVVRKFYKTARN